MTEDSSESAPVTDPEGDTTMAFSLQGLRSGFLEGVPVSLGVAGYGIAFGVLASQAGLSLAEAVLMSGAVFAGAAQLIAVELWETPLPAVAIVGTVCIVNLRYVLMGAALRPWFSRLGPSKAYGSLFFITDETWALTMRAFKSGRRQGAYLLGCGLALWSFWVLATILGVLAGGRIGDPAQYGLDFVLTAVFLAIAVGLWEGRSSAAPWTGAIGVSILAAQTLPGRWYILLGGLAGAFIEVIRHDR